MQDVKVKRICWLTYKSYIKPVLLSNFRTLQLTYKFREFAADIQVLYLDHVITKRQLQNSTYVRDQTFHVKHLLFSKFQ
jgi:hypothetical protein